MATTTASQQGRDEHRALHPPAQRDAEALVVRRAGVSRSGSCHSGRRARVRRVELPRDPVLRLDPGPAAAVVRPPGRRRRRPGDHRRRDARAGGAGAGADRGRDRAARRVRRAGAPALGAGGPARAVDREHPGHRRRRLPRRDQGAADQPRPARADRAAPRRPDRPAGRPAVRAGARSSRWRHSPSRRARGRGLRFYRRLRAADPARDPEEERT